MNALNIKDIGQFRAELKKRFLEKISHERFFRLAATPIAYTKIDVSSDIDKANAIFLNPPYKRESGWTTEVIGKFISTLEGLENDDYTWRHLIFLKNGFLEFWARVDDSFCWKQNSDEMQVHPRLYPYAVCEYPMSFFNLLKGLIDAFSISSGYILEGGFYNCKGAYMRPGHPKSIIYQSDFYKPVYWDHDYPLEFREKEIENNFVPEQEAYKTVIEIYNAFGISDKEAIPFFDQNGKFFLKDKG